MLTSLAMLLLQTDTGATTETTSTISPAGGAAIAGVFGIFVLIYLAVILLLIIGMWKIFTKAGKPGWASIIPIYNLVVLTEITGKPIYWIFIAPFLAFPLATVFGKSTGFALGMLFLPFIFYPMLGFGDARYQGPGRMATV